VVHTIKIKDWYWDGSVPCMVFEDQSGQKYQGKTRSVVIGREYSVNVEDDPSEDGHLKIVSWI
jgi:hypothetical protein